MNNFQEGHEFFKCMHVSEIKRYPVVMICSRYRTRQWGDIPFKSENELLRLYPPPPHTRNAKTLR